LAYGVPGVAYQEFGGEAAEGDGGDGHFVPVAEFDVAEVEGEASDGHDPVGGEVVSGLGLVFGNFGH